MFGSLLIIDDEKELLETTKDLLSDVFQEILTASSGQEAFDLLSQRTFDLIISDHNMAEVTGLELIKVLRTEGIVTPFIMVSGHVSKDLAIYAMRLGVSDILEKPVSDDDLHLAVARTLELEKHKHRFYKTADGSDPDMNRAHKEYSAQLAQLFASTKIAS